MHEHAPYIAYKHLKVFLFCIAYNYEHLANDSVMHPHSNCRQHTTNVFIVLNYG